MKKKKEKSTVEKFDLTRFPVEIMVSVNQLNGLCDYDYYEKAVTFDGGIEYRIVVVSGHRLSEEPADEQNIS